MSISAFRSLLYGTAKYLGDVQAIAKAARTQSAKPIGDRILRRLLGKLTSRLISAIVR